MLGVEVQRQRGLEVLPTLALLGQCAPPQEQLLRLLRVGVLLPELLDAQGVHQLQLLQAVALELVADAGQPAGACLGLGLALALLDDLAAPAAVGQPVAGLVVPRSERYRMAFVENAAEAGGSARVQLLRLQQESLGLGDVRRTREQCPQVAEGVERARVVWAQKTLAALNRQLVEIPGLVEVLLGERRAIAQEHGHVRGALQGVLVLRAEDLSAPRQAVAVHLQGLV
mmetsp:Transcript_11814/g.36939  ORF Transcript_11814/g.36939 Transcript_11814/m.36939 type:complete len:228 (-) Transcript_11814:1420-2103(-)